MKQQQRELIFYAAIIGLLAVALGAFGAHALREFLDETRLQRFDLGIRYAYIHCLAIVATALALPLAGRPEKMLLAAWMFMAGVVVFSGSLILLGLTDIRFFAAITPLGGLCLLLGWGFFAYSIRGK